MIARQRLTPLALLALLLGGCVSGAAPPATPRAVPSPGASTPPITQKNALIGLDANAALRLFGQPRIDLVEGAGRRLQFAGSACLLDVYLYAPRPGAQAVATHVDARTPEGRSAEVNSCINALRR